MNEKELLVLALQCAGGIGLAPVIPGLIRTVEARLQGRRGPSPFQPYRELRRLWGRSRISPEPRSPVYDLAPVVVAATALLGLLFLPIGRLGTAPGLGADVLVLIGLLGLGRFAIALSAWDTGSGFALMGAGRDLTFAVFAEALLVISLLGLALGAGTLDLAGMASAATDPGIWAEPARWTAILGLALVVVAETGRRPVDNPETHLELTMIQEGPALEYGGRDLALLEWAAAARHWILLVLVAQIALPHPGGTPAQIVLLLSWVFLAAALLAITESVQAKMRILRVPLFLGVGIAVGLLGIGVQLWGGLG